MPTLNGIGQRRERAAADIHTTAAALAATYDVHNPIADIPLAGMRATDPTPTQIANHNAEQMELAAAMLHLFESIIGKIAPLG